MYGYYKRCSSHLKQVEKDLNFYGQLKPKHFKENKIRVGHEIVMKGHIGSKIYLVKFHK